MVVSQEIQFRYTEEALVHIDQYSVVIEPLQH